MARDNDANYDVETGIETNSPIETGIEDAHDVYYFADDGEFGYVIGATDVTDLAENEDVEVEDGHRLYHIKHYVCEAGLVDEFSAKTTHEVRDGRINIYLGEYFEEIGEPHEAISAAKEHFEN